MRLVFTSHGFEDYTYWQTADRNTLKRNTRLVEDVLRDPFAGIGKPEQLRHAPAGSWLRRIRNEQCLVYLIDGEDVVVLQARYHYS